MRKPETRRVWRVPAAVVFILLLIFAGYTPAIAAGSSDAKFTLEMLTDPSGSMTIEDIRSEEARARFQPLAGNGLNLGYTRDAVWLRLSVPAEISRAMLVSLTPNFVDLLDVYVLPPSDESRAPVHYAMGDHRPLSDDAFSGLQNVVPIDLIAGQVTEVFVRAAAVSSVLSLDVSLYPPADHTYKITVSSLAFGGWFGGMAILLIIQLVFFYYNRMLAFAFLAFSTFVAMLVYFGTLGLSRLFLFPQGGEGNDMFVAGASWFGIVASVMAARLILDIPGKAPWIDRIFLAGALMGALGVGFSLAGYNMEFGPFAQATIVLLATAGVVQSFRSIDPSDASTRLRATAFLSLCIGLLATTAQRAGIVPLPNWIAHGYAVSNVAYAILLTGALAVRLRASEVAATKMREEALALARNAENRANRLVEERTSDLAKAKHVAEEALAAELASKEQQIRFMEVISHQYRTPLAAVQTHISNIGMSLPNNDSANQRRLERVRKGVARLVEVLEVNLSRSRLQGSAFEPHLSAQPAVPLVEAAATRARDLLQIDPVCSIAGNAKHVCIEADSHMLEIAIINLLENAAKFSRPDVKGSVSLNVALREGALAIEIKDHGIGIPQDDIPRLLEPNFRASNAANVAGTGSGLSLVARVAAAHQGTVDISSTLGTGTTVRLLIPLAHELRPAHNPFEPTGTK